MPKFLEGAMSQSTGEHVVQNWRENVKQVKTMSALHMYLGILENSVKWDKSAENAVSNPCFIETGKVVYPWELLYGEGCTR